MYFLNINKPKGMSSFDVIRELRKRLKIKQIGHSGTLDPLASGVLQIAVGNATKLLDYLDSDKEYVAELVFGYRGKTVTYAVTVENKREVDLAAIYSEGLFNLSQGDLINEKNLKLLVKYSNFKPVFVEDYDDDDFDIYIGNEKCEYDHERKGFIASSSTKPLVVGEQSSSIITVVSKVYSDDYDYFSVEIRHVAGEYLVDFDFLIVLLSHQYLLT